MTILRINETRGPAEELPHDVTLDPATSDLVVTRAGVTILRFGLPKWKVRELRAAATAILTAERET